MVVIACFMKIIYVGWLADKAIGFGCKSDGKCCLVLHRNADYSDSIQKSKLADGIAAGMVILACILSYFVYSTPTDNAKAQFIFASIFVLVITYFFKAKSSIKQMDWLIIAQSILCPYMYYIQLWQRAFEPCC